MYLDDLKTKYRESGFTNVDAPLTVAFDITTKCNLRCRHCYNRSGEEIYKDMTDEQLLSVAKQVAEMHPVGVCLCGGEPLLRKEMVYKILDILSGSCGGVNMVSNGWLLDEQTANKLKELHLNTLQISIDGDTEFLHDNLRQKKGAFRKAVKAIEFGKNAGLNMVVSCCPHKLNYKRIGEICDFCYSLGVKEFRVMPFIPMGRGAEMKNLALDSEEYLFLQQTLYERKKYYTYKDYLVDWGDPIDHLYRMPENDVLGVRTYGIEVRADGKLIGTTYLPIVFGNCLEHTIREYWEIGYSNIWGNAKYLEYTSSIKNIYDFDKFKPRPYSGQDLNIELIT